MRGGVRCSGSYTVEAAIQVAFGVRGRVAEAMVLHEAVVTARHE